MMKMIVDMDVYDEKSKEKIMASVAGLPGIYKPYMELKEGTLIVIGNINPVEIVTKLKKKWRKANLTLFVPYDATEEAEMAEAKEKIEAFERDTFYRSSNHEYRNLHVHAPHCNLVNDYEQGCVIC